MDNSTSLGALPSTVPPSNALLVIVEGDAQGKGKGKPRERQDATIGLVSVVPATGDVIWDEFDGGPGETMLHRARESFLTVPPFPRLGDAHGARCENILTFSG